MTVPVASADASIDVSVIVVAYNAPELLERCLRSVTGEGAPSVSHEVIVLDNASSPSVIPLLRQYLPEDSVVDVGDNIGFGRACNLGAARARGRYVLLLNPDAEARPGAIDAMVVAADAEPRCGVLGGRAEHDDGSLDPQTCWGAPTLWSTLTFALGLSTLFARSAFWDPESLGRWARDTARDVPVVTGCLMLVPRELWSELGGFDPDYFLYSEDADLCRRVLDAGRRVWITPDAVITHAWGASSASSGDKMVRMMRGRTTYIHKHLPGVRGRLAGVLLLAGVSLRGVVFGAAGRRDNGWYGAWSRRSEWRGGYAPFEPGRSAAGPAQA